MLSLLAEKSAAAFTLTQATGNIEQYLNATTSSSSSRFP